MGGAGGGSPEWARCVEGYLGLRLGRGRRKGWGLPLGREPREPRLDRGQRDPGVQHPEEGRGVHKAGQGVPHVSAARVGAWGLPALDPASPKGARRGGDQTRQGVSRLPKPRREGGRTK